MTLASAASLTRWPFTSKQSGNDGRWGRQVKPLDPAKSFGMIRFANRRTNHGKRCDETEQGSQKAEKGRQEAGSGQGGACGGSQEEIGFHKQQSRPVARLATGLSV
jgi:hypothetical protein